MPFFLYPLLKWLGGFLTGPLAHGVLDAYKAKLTSQNDTDTHTVELATREMDLEQRQAELNNQIMLAEQGRWYTAIIRPLFAAPFIIYNFKLIVWDKVLAYGATDPLSEHLLQLEATVIMFYFGGRTLEKVTSIITTRRAK